MAPSQNSTGDLLDDPQSGKTPTNLGLLMGKYQQIKFVKMTFEISWLKFLQKTIQFRENLLILFIKIIIIHDSI